MSAYRNQALIGLLLIAATVTAYWPLWRNGLLDHDDTAYGFLLYDDSTYVERNPHVHAGLTAEGVRWAFTTTRASNWHPLTWLSLQLDAEAYGLRPWGYHLTNVLLHLANALLLFIALRRLTGAVWPSGLAAALFAVHPLHVESVAWVAERKDVLSTFFGLLALWAYAGYAARPTPLRYLAVFLAFGLSLLAKPMLVTLPFLLLLLDYWPLGRLRPGGDAAEKTPGGAPAGWRRLVVEKLPLFGLALASCVVTVYAQHRGGAMETLDYLPIPARTANALVAYVSYLGKTFWPVDLVIFYPHPRALPPWWQLLGSALVLVGVSAVALKMARRCPYLLVGWLWYLGTLVPVIGLVQVGLQAQADRYTYVPLIGVFVALAWGLGDAVRHGKDVKRVALLATAFVLAACVVCCRSQLRYWHDDRAIWEHDRAVTHGNYVAALHLGLYFVRDPKTQDRALEYLDEAIRHKPNAVTARVHRGAVLVRKGRWDEAEEDLRIALAIDPDNVLGHNNLGIAYAGKNQVEAAAREFAAAVELDPNFPEPHSNLGLALEQLGRPAEALAHCDRAVRLAPGEARYRRALAYVLQTRGEIDAARAEYRESLALDPTWPETANQMARALATDPDPKQRNAAVSLRLARQACAATDDQRPDFLETLAAAYAAAESYDKASAVARKALARAEAAGRPDLARRIEQSLRGYQSRRLTGRAK